MKKLITIILIIIIIVIIVILYALGLKRQTTSSVLSPNAREPLSAKRVIGFLPYWQESAIDTLRFELLSEVIYFGLHANEQGEIETRDSENNRDQGYTRFPSIVEHLQKRVDSLHTYLSIGIILQDNEKLEIFLGDDKAQANLIENVTKLINQYRFTGVNLDFEYSGIPSRETVAQFSSFVGQFSQKIKGTNPNLVVSVDITADAIKKSRLYDVQSLAKTVDYLILMGYDFYRPASSVAGPVAPLTGKELYEYDVTTAVSDFLSVVPSEKLVLGVPYYGWDFPTLNDERGALVERRPDEAVALSTYKRTRRLIEEANPHVKFDEESQTPWMTYSDPDSHGIRQVWFENEISLGKKYDLVNKQSLAGIAIWALGYDGDNPNLWELLREKFRK